MSSGLSPERSELGGAARGGAGQFAQSEGAVCQRHTSSTDRAEGETLEPRREQAQRDNGKKRGAVVNRRSVTTDDFGLDEEL